MAKVDEVRSALRVLAKNAELVASAYLDGKGLIPNEPEFEGAVSQLKRQRLVWVDDENDEVHLSIVVHRLLDHSLKNFRRHQANEAIGSLWDHLHNDLLEQYREAKRKGIESDKEQVSNEIQEVTFELVERLAEATGQFSQYIVSRFAYIKNLDLRVQQNKMVLSRARKLNDLLASFDIDEIYQMSQGDNLLRKMFGQLIPSAIARCQADLVGSMHQLMDMLHALRKNLEYSRLISLFESKYQNDRGFMPAVDRLLHCPEALTKAEGLSLVSTACFDDARYIDDLAELAVGLRPSPLEVVIAGQTQIDNATMLPGEELEPDPVQEAASVMVKAAVGGAGVFHALESYKVFEMDCGEDLWIYAVLNASQALSADERKLLKIEYKESRHRDYPDNYIVHDVSLSRRNA